MKLLLICSLFILLSCGTDVQQNTQKISETSNISSVKTPLKIEKLNKVIVILDDNEYMRNIFYDIFSRYAGIENIDTGISFYYSVNEIPQDIIENTIIIGPNASDELTLLKKKLVNNNLILSLTNDLTLQKQFSKDEIIFLGMGPFHHLLKLKDKLNNIDKIAVLYKQNYYGSRLNNFFKLTYPMIEIKSSPYGNQAIDINFAIQALGELSSYDMVLIVDDTFSYKDIITNLSSSDTIYPYEKIYLIDNFLEQRDSISSFYSQIKRVQLMNVDILNNNIPHRELFYRASIGMALRITEDILLNKYNKITYSKQLGHLEVFEQTINFPIIFN